MISTCTLIGTCSSITDSKSLSGFPEHFRDLPDDKRNIALWRREFAEELLSCYQTGLARRNEPSVAKVLQAVITAVESRLRQRRRGQCKRAGRIETKRTPPCAKTILIWARTYEKSGFDIMSLVPTTHRCGRRERMVPGELAAFEKLIAEYATPLRPTIGQIHERATNLYADFNRERAVQKLAELRVPSRSAVYRAIKRLDPYETCLQREGVDAANKKFAIVEYGVQVLRPMERVEIDEWDIDLFALVSRPGLPDQLTKDEVAILQAVRLIICVVIDCATRCIVGFTLSRSTSSGAAIRAMEMATIDKTSIAMSFGCRAGWHQGGRPESLAADQGSAFVNEDFKITCAGLLTRPINPPAGVAKLRSRIERLFGTFASHFVSRFRGRTFSDPVRRGGYASEAEASLTEQDLLGAFVTYIVDVYHPRRLCERHGIGLKITAQVLKDQYGIWRCASHEVDPDLIAGLAPKLKGLLNTGDPARHLGTSIDVFRGLVRDGLLVPDYRFNDRMAGFSSTTLDAFISEWCEGARCLESEEEWIIHPFRSLYARTGPPYQGHFLVNLRRKYRRCFVKVLS